MALLADAFGKAVEHRNPPSNGGTESSSSAREAEAEAEAEAEGMLPPTLLSSSSTFPTATPRPGSGGRRQGR
jgi:hypothetical protein